MESAKLSVRSINSILALTVVARMSSQETEGEMLKEWTNMQVVECETVDGGTVTVFKQTDGEHRRYVLGNGREVMNNADGTFTIPETATDLTVVSI